MGREEWLLPPVCFRCKRCSLYMYRRSNGDFIQADRSSSIQKLHSYYTQIAPHPFCQACWCVAVWSHCYMVQGLHIYAMMIEYIAISIIYVAWSNIFHPVTSLCRLMLLLGRSPHYINAHIRNDINWLSKNLVYIRRRWSSLIFATTWLYPPTMDVENTTVYGVWKYSSVSQHVWWNTFVYGGWAHSHNHNASIF